MHINITMNASADDGNGHVPTCHQKLDASLLRHLLCWMVSDEIKHVGSTVRLSQVTNPQRTIFCSQLPQVLDSVLVGWIWENTSAVEHIADTDRHTDLDSTLFLWTLYHEFLSCVWFWVLNITLVWYSGFLRDTTSQTNLCTAVLHLLHPC